MVATVLDEFRGRSVFLTGHTGFKGSWLSLWLSRLGASLTGYSLDPPTCPSNYEEARVSDSLHADLRGDVRDAEGLTRALRAAQPDVVFHLAAQSTVAEGYRSPRATFETNVLGTACLLDAIRELDRPCVVILVSSDKCYQNQEHVWGYRETDALGGSDPYSASKGAMELLVAAYRGSYFPPESANRHGVKLATVRAGNVIGGGDWTPKALLVDTIRALQENREVPLRNPDAVRPWQHVLEPLHGYLRLAARLLRENDPQLSGAWNFGPLPGEEVPVRELVRLVFQQWGTGRCRDACRPGQLPEASQLRLSIDKSLWQLGWRPRWNLRQAVAMTVQWYQERQALPRHSTPDVGELCRRQLAAFEASEPPAPPPADALQAETIQTRTNQTDTNQTDTNQTDTNQTDTNQTDRNQTDRNEEEKRANGTSHARRHPQALSLFGSRTPTQPAVSVALMELEQPMESTQPIEPIEPDRTRLDPEGPDATVRPASSAQAPCRFCAAPLTETFVDLGLSPLCESYVTADQLDAAETFYPLRVLICRECLLVQLREYVSGESIFRHYAYFSSYSESWLRHAEGFADQMTARLGLGPDHRVVEVASNDGYLLQYFAARGIPCLGVEPAANVARAAIRRGIPTRVAYFGAELAGQLAREHGRADLLIGNNVLAHVPRLHDFVAGLKVLLAPRGVLSLEFPHLPRLIEGSQFDTIYHEHFCYFSFHTARQVLAAHRLHVFDVERLPTHGGSLRLLACHAGADAPQASPRVADVVDEESAAGYDRLETYRGFSRRVAEIRRQLLEFLITARGDGRAVVGYGAPGKGNTLLNYCGVRPDLLEYTVDRNPFKQGKFLPGTRIPVRSPQEIDRTRPDFLLILPWNLRQEIVQQMSHVRHWGCRFVVPIPRLEIF